MSAAAYRAAILAQTPRAYWEMQDASGFPQDSSGNALHMTAISAGADYRQPGPMSDFSIRLIGGETIQRSAHVSTVTSNFTVLVWVDAQAVTVNGQLIFYNGNSGTNGWGIVAQAAGNFAFLAGGVAQGPNSANVIEGAGFRCIGVKRAATQWTYYHQGTVDTANAGTNAPGAPNGTVVIGSGSIQQAVAHVAVFETALSDATVAAIFQAGIGGDTELAGDAYSWYAN